MRPAKRSEGLGSRHFGNFPLLAVQYVGQRPIGSMQAVHQQPPLHPIVNTKRTPFIEGSFDGSRVKIVAGGWPEQFPLVNRG